ncbi:efflux RND transporter periplasmic adaptor subunit [Pseudomonas xanthosomatis]|uniref:efflux RND transporter periplasmic adaptor subunit n=1 Tax=Pseudomonas xanthosomatis TaxID=2842356 RepID=UPI0035175CFF
MSRNKTATMNPSKKFLVGGVALVVIAVGSGLAVRSHQASAVEAWAIAHAEPTVSTVIASADSSEKTLRLPATLAPWSDAPIHARVSGYLKRWTADLGTRVKAGDVLAEIDSPELDQQIAQAKADLEQARAQAAIARLTASRWQRLLAEHSVSQQDADEKTADSRSISARADAAKANYERLVQMGQFKVLRAPFDGIVTARKTDVGQLIHADNTSGPELFHMVALHDLRLLVPVPQSYATALSADFKAKLRVPERPGEAFDATLMSTAGSIDQRSGTLMAQFKVSNPGDRLLPGGYAEVELPVGRRPSSVAVPATSLIFRKAGPQVAVVDKAGLVALRDVHIGLDLGTLLQLDAGLQAGEQVIDNPPDGLRAGDKVKVAEGVVNHAPKA